MHKKRNKLLALLIICFTTQLSAVEQDTVKRPYLVPVLSGSARIPLATSFWKPFFTTGVHCIIPSTIKGISCIGGVEGGHITDKNGTLEIQCLDVRCGLLFTDLIKYHYIMIVPSVGISSLMIGAAHNGLIDITQWHVFGRVENEFGVYAGIEPAFRYSRFHVSIPVSVESIFSYPDRFTTLVVSVQAGYRF